MKTIKLILMIFLMSAPLIANEPEVFVKSEKQEMQEQPKIAKGTTKIVLGAITGLAFCWFKSPYHLVNNIRKECCNKPLKLEPFQSQVKINLKKIAANGLGLAAYGIPAYLIVDGLADLHVFKKIKESLSRKRV